MKTSETCADFMAAFAKAQANFKNPVKNKEVKYGATKFKYADLTACLDAVLPSLNAEGIALTQGVTIEGEAQVLITRLSLGNEWMTSEYPLGAVGADHKDIGAAYTYGKRYSVVSMTGISADEDGDASSITTKSAAPKKATPKPNAAQEWADDAAKAFKAIKTSGEQSSWIETNKGFMDKLETGHPDTFKTLDDVIKTEQRRVSNAEVAGKHQGGFPGDA